ncbi:DUF2271 domain-containing protein [Roseateles amylovorans]|jgi:hypothetical protein|uniref:DUF2271 domain-containing protein n=1 Tax=Roseateles amylovorans TaxID=2978473 RepID=A0ABY6AZF8_9BURK|nr:DUF2271 domain-containing protein [Roseateles amylovorans]UXH78175.1 DUF2271 domain-containing protein [Roseateles amylovorans]
MNRSASRHPSRALLALGALGTLSAGSSAWAATVQLKLELPRLNVAEYHRPYVAVWVEKAGESGPAVAQLAIWYDIKKQNNAGTKWLRDMRQWWRQGGRNLTVPADGISGATRAPGEHTLSFDTHPSLANLPAGKYEIVVESGREAGGREVQRLPLTWPIKAEQKSTAQGEHELGALELIAKP